MDSADLDVDAKQHLYPIHESQKRSCHMAAPFFVDLIQHIQKNHSTRERVELPGSSLPIFHTGFPILQT